MVFLISLLGVVAFAVVCKKALKKLPVLFYAVAIVLVIGYVYAFFFGDLTPFWRSLLPVFQRCLIALSFFMLVMFIGVFPSGSALRGFFMPIRRQLSILGAIFTSGHVIVYSFNLFPRYFTGGSLSRLDLTVSLTLALLIALMLIPLTITSFNIIKKRMKAESWKRVQLLAYPFFILTYVHLMFILAPTVVTGNASSIFNLALYTLLFGSYLVLRIRKHVVETALDKREKGAAAVAAH